ncbi:MAG: hypothetical protein HUU20_22405 [Pirellulales bacterium]|nr:hypothetical protein [Pirellulales bacterium]
MEELRKQVRRTQRWLALQRFVGVVGWSLSITFVLALVIIGVGKFRPLGVDDWIWIVAAVGLGSVAAAAWTFATRRGAVDAAIELDRRFGLKERVSSTLAMSPEERQTQIGQALVADAVRRVSRIDVQEHFGIRPGRHLLLPLVPATVAVLAALFVSPMARQNPAQAGTQSEAVKKQVKTSSESLRKKLAEKRKEAEKEGLKDAQQLFQRLQQGADELATKAPADRKQALVKLNDLARELEKRRDSLGGADEIQKQLNRLKSVSRGPADRFLDAVTRGDFKKAMQELEQLKADVASGKLSDQQRAELARQMEEMKQKLEQLADAARKTEEDLEKQIEQARQMGQNQEVDKLQEQLDRLRQQLPQMDQIQELAQKLGQCSQCLKDGQFQNAGEMLNQLQQGLGDLEERLQELEMLDEAMNQLAQAREQMNCPNCGGLGCEQCEGRPGFGMGKGRGQGDRPEAETDSNFYDTKPPLKTGPGAAFVVGEVNGPNLKGDVRQEIQEQIQAARQQETDPLTGQQMPRKHRQHAKEYFDSFREGK